MDEGRGSQMCQFYEPKPQFTRLELVLASLFRKKGDGILFSLNAVLHWIHDHKKKCLNVLENAKKLWAGFDSVWMLRKFTKNLHPLKQII